ncbi:MarR family transcriptional regulator [Actinomadura flavalba]|uniref:MarR family transcriptional regulator n=1 Tax=Actinomadura flavalba TaxID=1120938 RepID=UPI00037769FB|nr:MarR family transcriptional regulator [Actinomadura flavalba]
MQDPLSTLERELMLLGRHAAIGAVRDGASTGRLERSAYLLLRRIDAEGPLTIGQLAAAFGLDVSTVNRQTAAMLRSGVVERIPDPDGGMARKFRITAEGARRLDRDRQWAMGGLSRVLSGWDAADVTDLTRLLTLLNTSIEDREGRPWPRDDEHARS